MINYFQPVWNILMLILVFYITYRMKSLSKIIDELVVEIQKLEITAKTGRLGG